MTFYSGAYMDLKRRKAGLKLSKCPDDDGGKGKGKNMYDKEVLVKKS